MMTAAERLGRNQASNRDGRRAHRHPGIQGKALV